MPNKIKYRKIAFPPIMDGYKPYGLPLKKLESVTLLLEEFEAIRLIDYETLCQDEASKKMNISRPTFNRLYDKARKKIAKAFVEGKMICISGGNYTIEDFWYKCQNCKETLITLKPIKQCRNCESVELKQFNTDIEA